MTRQQARRPLIHIHALMATACHRLGRAGQARDHLESARALAAHNPLPATSPTGVCIQQCHAEITDADRGHHAHAKDLLTAIGPYLDAAGYDPDTPHLIESEPTTLLVVRPGIHLSCDGRTVRWTCPDGTHLLWPTTRPETVASHIVNLLHSADHPDEPPPSPTCDQVDDLIAALTRWHALALTASLTSQQAGPATAELTDAVLALTSTATTMLTEAQPSPRHVAALSAAITATRSARSSHA